MGMFIELSAFTVFFAALWWHRRMQLKSIRQQREWHRVFSEAVTEFRGREDVAQEARSLVEGLVNFPVDARSVRRVALRIIFAHAHPTKDDQNKLLDTLRALPPDAREAFAHVIVAFFLTFTAGDWLFGGLLRRIRLGGLDRKTQAEVAIGTVGAYA
jgi:hypothetical protein